MAKKDNYSEVVRIGIDLAKNSFQVHGVNKYEKCVLVKKLQRKEMHNFFSNFTSCLIGMEACGGAHYWARELVKQGHQVKLIAAQHVKPFVKSQKKNDRVDAEAICEALGRPNMLFIAHKTVDQQVSQMAIVMRKQYDKRYTALGNEIRGLLMEHGFVIPQGKAKLKEALPSIIEKLKELLPSFAVEMFQELCDQLLSIDLKLKEMDKKVKKRANEIPECKRLQTICGVGPVSALTLHAAVGDGKQFKNGRMMAAWLGLVPRQFSTGGKTILGKITRNGNCYLRSLLVNGSRSAINASEKKDDKLNRWIKEIKYRKGNNIASVALANKITRIAWVILTKGETFKAVA